MKLAAELAGALYPRSRGKIVYCDPDIDRDLPESDADVLLIEFPNELHLEVAWEDKVQVFRVVLSANQFSDELKKAVTKSWSGIGRWLLEMSRQAYLYNRSSQSESDVWFAQSSPSFQWDDRNTSSPPAIIRFDADIDQEQVLV